MEGISFKKATASDIELLIPVAQKAYLQAYTHVWEHEEPAFYLKKAFTKKAFLKDLSDSNTEIQLIYFANTLVGFYKLELDSAVSTYTAIEAIQLEKIYILNEFSGKGIGNQSLAHIISGAKQKGKSVFWVDVMDTSPAKFFYQKMGFETFSYWDLDYPGLKADQLKMHRMVKKLL
ncbi:GNAT family N-acetyltransferase [Spongiivirga citrea]|uniref:GNAT family N-acetyltransferase n=1 Tax=Spongiivirga citrea TaxID=1481457 RepID=A0A6M0CEA4_9FLAO|nr:GNAT family N-acetyltransferase [Spongiivirga citrea]NER16061.1 GNAT family N-acetyltransferase [Spongiivirga citrea]